MSDSIVRIDKRRFGPWALVTGASSGLGAEFARQLAANGLHLVLVARREKEMALLGGQLHKQYGIEYRVVATDLTQEQALSDIERATEGLEVGLVIGNAGSPLPGLLVNQERSDLFGSIRLKAFTNAGLARLFGEPMVRRGRGGLLLVASIGGLQGVPYLANNAAGEGFVLNLGEALNLEWRDQGVNVSVLMPGPTDTPGLASMGIHAKDMPMKPMSAAQCVREGLQALMRNEVSHVAGRANRTMAKLMPRRIASRLVGQMIGKRFAENAGKLART